FIARTEITLPPRVLCHVEVSVFSFPQPLGRGFASAAAAKMLPQPEPGAMREHLVVPSIGSRDVTRAEWPNIRRFEHFLKLLNLVNDAFNVHASKSSKEKPGSGKPKDHLVSVANRARPTRSIQRPQLTPLL